MDISLSWQWFITFEKLATWAWFKFQPRRILISEQAGAELGQALIKLELGFTLIKIYLVNWTSI